jgi:hypothetical protein
MKYLLGVFLFISCGNHKQVPVGKPDTLDLKIVVRSRDYWRAVDSKGQEYCVSISTERLTVYGIQ